MTNIEHQGTSTISSKEKLGSPTVNGDEPLKTKKSIFSFMKKEKKEKKVDSLQEEERLAGEKDVRFPLKILFLIGFDWVWILLSCFFYGLSGAVPILFQIIFGDIINVVAVEGATINTIKRGINDLALKLLYVAVGAAITNGLGNFFSGIAAASLGNRLKRKMYKRLLSQEMGYFDIRKVGILVKRISEDTKNVENAYAVKLGQLCQYVVQFIVGIIMAFTYSWLMTLFLLSFAPLFAFTMVFVGGGEGILAKLTSRVSDQATAKATEVISTMKTVRSMSGEDKEYEYFKKQFKSASKLAVLRSSFKALGFFIVEGLIWGACAFAFFIGGKMIAYGINGHTLTLGTLMQTFGSILFAIIGGVLILALFPDLVKGNVSAAELIKSYNRKPNLKFRGGDKIENLRGEIEFKNVDFSYPSRPDVQILKNFSLKIPVGKTTAFVGASGSGKSTITNLIEFFYDVQEGEVLLDGKRIRDLDPKWLHEHIGIVTQEPTLFSGTIEDNIKYGIPKGRSITKKDIVDAAKMANAHNFIMNFKDGYNTLLGESSGLSGGQKQRIAIARMCLLNPKVILQDESTSALDSESEKIVQDALNKLTQGRTAIVIAHRLSTIKEADQIVVMEKGKVVEIGTHNELIAKGPKGAYYRLAEKQVAFGQDSTAILGNFDSSLPMVRDSANPLSEESALASPVAPAEDVDTSEEVTNENPNQQ